MTLLVRLSANRLLCAVLSCVALASCTSVSKGPGGEVTKVKYYFHDPLIILRTQDPAVFFERQHHMHGAVRAADQLGRAGHYYTVMWKADDRSQPVTVRLEYRQANTALKVHVKEQEVTDVRKRNETQFQVIGTDYQLPYGVEADQPEAANAVAGGRVTAWRVSLLRGKEELASQESYLWK